MNFKSYPSKATTPNRKVRKGMRLTVYLFNSGAKHAQRKAERIARKALNP